MVLVKPATVIQWHRKGFGLDRRDLAITIWLSGTAENAQGMRSPDLQNEHRPSFVGRTPHPRRAAQARYRREPSHVGRKCHGDPHIPSPTWRSFLRNHMSDTVAVDMFVVATATFWLLYTVIILGHDRQRIIHFDVTQIRPKAGSHVK